MAGERPRLPFVRTVLARPRLCSGVLVALAAFFLAPPSWGGATRALAAWNLGTILYVGATLATAVRATPATIRWRAALTDEGRFVILVLVSLAAFAALGAIIAQLAVTKDLKSLAKGLHLALAAFTVVSAWVFIHLTYAMHYAHEYFDETKGLPGEAPQPRGGVAFPGTDEPDYWDFFYFSFIIGVAAQTADVVITSKSIRRTSLAHSILSFFFNSTILALTINIAAGLI